jgi:hypothetical protein
MKRLALLLLATGCSAPRVVYQRVEVPIAVPCPEPPPLALPDLPIFHLNKPHIPQDPTNAVAEREYQKAFGEFQAEMAKAYVSSLVITLGKLREAIAILDGYRPKKATK